MANEAPCHGNEPGGAPPCPREGISRESQLIIFGMLSDIRRRLALGHISTDSALRQADIALCGMVLDDIVKDELKTVMESFSAGEQEACKAIAFLATCEAIATNSKEDKANAAALLASAKDCLGKSKCAVDRLLGEQVRTLGKRVGLATGATDSTQSNEIQSKVISAAEALFRRYNEAVNRYNSLLASLASSGTVAKSQVSVPQVIRTEEKMEAGG